MNEITFADVLSHYQLKLKEAYDEVLNYLTLPNKPFGTGQLKYSESGMSHFVDCKKLFNLNISLIPSL